MPEYTFFAFSSLVIILLFDYSAKTHLVRLKKFWFFHGVVFVLTLIFDNYAIYKGIYSYDSKHILGILLPYAPLEDFLFGFSLITLNLILYERKSNKK